MKDGPDISHIAALIGDPARSNILTALMSGKALTASELAGEAGTFVHLYGKAESRPGRKMGHVTAMGTTADEAVDTVRTARESLGRPHS